MRLTKRLSSSDEIRLPSEERHVQVGLGQISIISASKEDSGFYKCLVLSLKGERYETLFHLKVVGEYQKQNQNKTIRMRSV